MSGFAAILRFDGMPADIAALAAMEAVMDYRGPDGIDRWVGDGAAMAHLKLNTTPESLRESQPLFDEDKRLVLVMDGWLANPDELRRELQDAGVRPRSASDAELVLRAYQTWGEGCARHIDGEYAFLIWDSRTREATCVKDHAGLRPLHYHWDGKRLLVASDIAGVLAAGDFEPQPNPGMIAEHLANTWCSTDETLWRGVTRMLPAHTMRVGGGGRSLQRYWMPPVGASIRYRDDRDYQAHYRELFFDSVRRASRTHRPLGCEVSGGLDSSAVFAAARRLEVDGQLAAPELKGYTYNFGLLSDRDVDEIDYARSVASHLGVTLREVAPFLPELEWFAERGRSDRDMPIYPNTAMAVNIGKAATQDGCRVVLNGEGGDEFLATYPFDYAEHLAAGDWRALRESWREDSADFGFRRSLARLYRFGIGPLLPGWLRALRRNMSKLSRANLPGWILLTPPMRSALAARHRHAQDIGPLAQLGPHARLTAMTMEGGFASYLHDLMNRNAARLGYELRSPMYDRRLIEFAAAIPSRQLRRGARQKVVHVAAMAGDLPPAVLQRRSKATFNLPFALQLDNITYGVVPPLLQCGIDCFDPEGLVQLHRRSDGMPTVERPVYELWAAFGCRTLFG